MNAKDVLVFLVLLLFSCKEEKSIYYEYEGVTVTRIDRGNKIYFYYGKCNLGTVLCSDKYIVAEYSGFISGMAAYLTFLPTGKVEVRRQAAWFEKKGNDNRIELIKSDVISSILWHDSIEGDYINTIKVFDVLYIEQAHNEKNQSKVKAYYP